MKLTFQIMFQYHITYLVVISYKIIYALGFNLYFKYSDLVWRNELIPSTFKKLKRRNKGNFMLKSN